MRVKILGAGSIGNHLSHAARRLGWSVDLCDVDGAALRRTRQEIYPGRYGTWDAAIRLFDDADAPRGNYDLIVIGTPPDSHMGLALEAVREKPSAVLVEKPLCTPKLESAQVLVDLASEFEVPVFCGYDHVVGRASDRMAGVIQTGALGNVATIDVEFREHWGGIFAAHPWLSGPADTYLGYWERGGGASGEHSHAINLWQHFAHLVSAGRVVEVSAVIDYVEDIGTAYDRLCLLSLVTESGLIGRVVQDVVTNPPRKWGRVQGAGGYVEWHCGYKPGCDAVIQGGPSGVADEQLFEKSRPDDFIRELRHLDAALAGDPSRSPIALERGLETMLVVAAAHRSAAERRAVRIDYAKGYSLEALAS
jgi:predicted dehydrogenase